MHLQDIGWRRGSMNWTDVAQDRDKVAGSCEHSDEPSGSMKCWEYPA